MKETLLGTILGDARLEWHGRGVRLTLNHSVAQKSYLEWKRQELASLHPSPLFLHAETRYPFWRFVTRIHPLLDELWNKFYVDGTKQVPHDIDRLLVAPKTLAVWFMDDGTIDKRQGSLLFETQCYPRNQIELLQRCLARNFEITSSIHKSGEGRGLRLYVPVQEAKKLAEIISPYTLPEMRYKLPVSL
jgi:hypothetical protein